MRKINIIAWIVIYSASLKRKPRFHTKSLKIKKTDHKIVISGWFIFVKHVKKKIIQVLTYYTNQCGCINCCFVVKAPANVIMQHKQRQLVLPNWLLCSHPWPIWMSNVPNKSILILLSCTEISLCYIFFSILKNFESNPGFFLRNSIKLLTQNLKKRGNFDMIVLQKLLLSSNLLSDMHDQCVIMKEG